MIPITRKVSLIVKGENGKSWVKKISHAWALRYIQEEIAYFIKKDTITTRFTSFGHLRKFILKRDNYKCFYCNQLIPSDQQTVDHLIPKSKGGLDSPKNCVAACLRCNRLKGKMDDWEFKELIERFESGSLPLEDTECTSTR